MNIIDTDNTPAINIKVSSDTSLEVKVVEAEILSRAETLFQEGREIGSSLDSKLHNAVDEFYKKAIPFGQKVWKEQPWKDKKFEEYRDLEPRVALLKFLRASFSDKGEGTAAQQASIVAMMIDYGLGPDKVIGAPFKHLTRLASNIRYLNKQQAEELLSLAVSRTNFRQYEAAILSAREGKALEPKKDKMISGSKSAIEIIDKACDMAKAAGDNRPQAEIIADILGEATYTGVNPAKFMISLEANKLFCEFWRVLNPSAVSFSDAEIISGVTTKLMDSYIDEMPKDILDRFNKIKQRLELIDKDGSK